ncbi:MAG TPA: hypothetical protein VMM17_05380 [Gemmatimonadaceae bacterium]|nr:hypothetical protein [Gemmatimonadaceae bacterium]
MRQTNRTLQEYLTTAAPNEVIAEAKRFFARQNGIYAAFPEQESNRHLTLRGQGGEEIALGVEEHGDGTRVTASTYLFDQQVARFFASLPPVAIDVAVAGVRS